MTLREEETFDLDGDGEGGDRVQLSHSSIIASSRDEDRTCARERCTRAALHVRTKRLIMVVMQRERRAARYRDSCRYCDARRCASKC